MPTPCSGRGRATAGARSGRYRPAAAPPRCRCPPGTRDAMSIGAFTLNAPDEREHGIDAEVQQERRSAAVPIRETAEQRRADEHADESGPNHRRQRHPAELKLLGQHGAQHAGEEDIEQIEEGTDAGNDGGGSGEPVSAAAGPAARRQMGSARSGFGILAHNTSATHDVDLDPRARRIGGRTIGDPLWRTTAVARRHRVRRADSRP